MPTEYSSSRKRRSVCSGYLLSVMDPDSFKRAYDQFVPLVKRLMRELNADAIAFTGISGAAMGFPLSLNLGLQVLSVRKAVDGSHHNRESDLKVEGVVSARRYLIIDDAIASGTTVQTIRAQITKERPDIECVGVALYEPGRHYAGPIQDLGVFFADHAELDKAIADAQFKSLVAALEHAETVEKIIPFVPWTVVTQKKEERVKPASQQRREYRDRQKTSGKSWRQIELR